MLVVDKSASMSGRKIELARQAAVGVIENLRPQDLLGVLIFDNTFRWVAPIRPVEDGAEFKRLIAGIVPDGGTQIGLALAEAYGQDPSPSRRPTSTSCCLPTASRRRAIRSN